MINRTIFHIDVNSAFLSWSAINMLQNGASVDLREIPSIVGGSQATRHGICLAKSIPAKKYGIQTGEPIIQSKAKCPNLVVVPPDYYLYMKASSAMFEILREYSDRVQVFSIDECFLDFTGMEKALGESFEVAHKIKDRINKELGFTVSIGISSNKLLAKMGSELKKPDAVSTLYPHEISHKMWILPVGDLYMCGSATESKLKSIGIFTIGDLAKTNLEFLKHKFKSFGITLHNYANGIEESTVNRNSHAKIKGISNSMTSHFDITDIQDAYLALLGLVETVAMRLRNASFRCNCISVEIKTKDLFCYSHQKKVVTPIDCTMAIFDIVKQLLNEMWKKEPIRHLGVRVTGLSSNEYVQLSFLEDNFESKRNVDLAVDKIRLKYGSKSIVRSTFLWTGLKHMQGGVVEEFPIMTSIL